MRHVYSSSFIVPKNSEIIILSAYSTAVLLAHIFFVFLLQNTRTFNEEPDNHLVPLWRAWYEWPEKSETPSRKWHRNWIWLLEWPIDLKIDFVKPLANYFRLFSLLDSIWIWKIASIFNETSRQLDAIAWPLAPFSHLGNVTAGDSMKKNMWEKRSQLVGSNHLGYSKTLQP